MLTVLLFLSTVSQVCRVLGIFLVLWIHFLVGDTSETPFFLHALQARNHYTQLFLLIGIGVSASCSLLHGAKQLLKHAVSKVTAQLCALHLEEAVGFTADVLLPTPFFGPYLTLYCLLGVVLREEGPDQQGVERRAGFKQGQAQQLQQLQQGQQQEESEQEEGQQQDF